MHHHEDELEDVTQRRQVETRKTNTLYVFILMSGVYDAACIKHLMQLKQWMALTGLGIETISIIILMLLLWRYRSPEHEYSVRQVAIFGMYCVLFVSLISFVALRWIA